MSIAVKIRRGEGAFWGTVKRAALAVLSFHLPATGVFRVLFGALYHLHVAGREGLIWLLRFFWYEPLFRSQCDAVGRQFQMEQLPYLAGRGSIVIGDGVQLSGKSSIGFSNRAHERPKLSIGDRSYIAHGCSFAVAQSISIGRHCLIAGGVTVRDFDGHPLDAERRRRLEPTPVEAIAPVVIGDDVWIGQGATVLKGVSIGARAIVASQAVVTKNVPADVIVAGNPARIVKSLPLLEPPERAGDAGA